MDQIIRIGMDTSKNVFQLHGVNAAEQVVVRRKLRRKEMIRFFEKLPAAVVAIEACGGSHHWARFLGGLGHEVRLIAPQLAKRHCQTKCTARPFSRTVKFSGPLGECPVAAFSS